MIDRKELMIGDWVAFDHTNYQVEEISVKGWVHITRDGVRVPMTTDFITAFLEPIPITPEILEKNGFGYKEEDRYGDEHITHFYPGEKQFCKDSDVHIGTNNEGHFWLNAGNSAIYGLRYVHELQHALKLCGIFYMEISL